MPGEYWGKHVSPNLDAFSEHLGIQALREGCPVKTDEFSEAFNPPPLVWQTILWIFGDWSRVAFFLFQKIICFDMLPNIVDGKC